MVMTVKLFRRRRSTDFDIHLNAQEVGAQYEHFVYNLRRFVRDAQAHGYSEDTTRASLMLRACPPDLVRGALIEEWIRE
jgi:hypothetical protein